MLETITEQEARQLDELPNGARLRVKADLLIMDRNGPRPTFDCYGMDGRYIGYLYPHNVFPHYHVTEVRWDPDPEHHLIGYGMQ